MEGKRLLIIGHSFPESRTTGAGKRMMQLISAIEEAGMDWHFATTAQKSDYADSLPEEQFHSILLNDGSFDTWIARLNPAIVIFDRFMTEEQFGWRVASICPQALRVLDTEDLHFLRKAREEALTQGQWRQHLYSDIARRELAAIMRSDLSLIISEFEFQLLKQMGVATGQMMYLPYWSIGQKSGLPGFAQRKHLVVLGNLLHAPNVDAVKNLADRIWPQIRDQIPEAQLHIYGAYGRGKFSGYHRPEQGFYLKGWVSDLSSILASYRINLCAVRFGAGLKIKLFDAMEYGIPSISTGIGAEGIAGELDFPGVIVDGVGGFALAAEQLYTDSKAWEQASKQADKVLKTRFYKDDYAPAFIDRLNTLQDQLVEHREENFIIQVLQHQSLQSTKYMSKWIEEKNRNKE